MIMYFLRATAFHLKMTFVPKNKYSENYLCCSVIAGGGHIGRKIMDTKLIPHGSIQIGWWGGSSPDSGCLRRPRLGQWP